MEEQRKNLKNFGLMSSRQEKQEQACHQKPFFPEHFQALIQEVSGSRARNVEDFGNALIGKVLIEFQMDDFLLPWRERLDNMLNAGKLFRGELGKDKLALDGVGGFVEILWRMFERQKNFRSGFEPVAVLENAVAKAGKQVGLDVIGLAERFSAFPQMKKKIVNEVFQNVTVAHEPPSVIEQWPVVVAQKLLEGKRVAFPELLPKYRILFHEKWVTSGANVPFFFVGKNPARAAVII
jgi:hypothetical protein